MTTAAFDHLFLHVTSLDRSRRFYELLGLEVLFEEPGYVRFGGSGGFTVGMEERSSEEVGGPGVEIEVRVDDVDGRHAELRSAGVDFTEPPRDMPWGARHAFLRDPDGYRVSIFSAA
jgi:catechol 2,3-dioxygenase-like lactoylglutathione lyase family enzyme